VLAGDGRSMVWFWRETGGDHWGKGTYLQLDIKASKATISRLIARKSRR